MHFCSADLRAAWHRHSLLPATLAGSLWALAGCASLAPPHTSTLVADVPAAWSTDALAGLTGAAAQAPWWIRFDDPLLARFVAEATQANTSVTSAQAAVRQARALRDVAAAGLLPTLGSSASAQHSTAGISAGQRSSTNSFRAGLDASWELDTFGANRNALNASDASARASAASLGDVKVSVAAEVGLSYLTLRSAQTRLAIAQANLASQLETLQITQWRRQAGLLTSLEAEQARAAAEQTRAALPALQTSIVQSRHALAVLTGRPPAALDGVLAEALPLPQLADDLALSIPAETLRRRPDVRAAELQVTAAGARVAQADAARLPSFKLGGSVGLNALTLGSLANGASVVSALLASVSLPVFDGGALRAQVRAQQAALDQAVSVYQATVLGALKDEEDALVALRGDRARRISLQQAAEAAGNAAELARARYSSGLVDFQTVLETQRTQLSTQDGVASASADVSADHVRLYKALGGGWQPDASVAVGRTPGGTLPIPNPDAARTPRT